MFYCFFVSFLVDFIPSFILIHLFTYSFLCCVCCALLCCEVPLCYIFFSFFSLFIHYFNFYSFCFEVCYWQFLLTFHPFLSLPPLHTQNCTITPTSLSFLFNLLPSHSLPATEPYYVIMEYVMFGKLLTFLRDHRTRQNYYNFSSDTAALTSHDLTRFACQVAAGCEYIQSRGVSEGGGRG